MDLFENLQKSLLGLIKKSDDPLGTITPEQLKVVLKSIEGKYNSLRDENRRLKSVIEEQRVTIAALPSARLDGSRGDGASGREEHPLGDDDLESDAATGSQRVQELQAQLSQIEAHRDLLGVQVAERDHELATLSSRLAAQTALVSALSEEKQRLVEADPDRLAELEFERKSLASNIKDLEARLQEALETKATALRLSDADSEKLALRAQIEELRVTVESQRKAISDLEDHVSQEDHPTEANGPAGLAPKADDSTTERLEQTLVELRELQGSYQTLELELEALQIERDQLSNAKDQMASDRDQIVAERDRLAAERELVEQAIADLPAREEAGEQAVQNLAQRLSEALNAVRQYEQDRESAAEAIGIIEVKLQATVRQREEVAAEAEGLRKQLEETSRQAKEFSNQTLGQEKRNQALAERVSELESAKEAEIASLSEKLEGALSSCEGLKAEIQTLQERNHQANATLQATQAHAENLLRRASEVEGRLAQKEEACEALAGIEEDLEVLRQERDRLESNLQEVLAERDELRRLVEPLRSQQQALNDRADFLASQQEAISSRLAEVSLRTHRTPQPESPDVQADLQSLRLALATIAEQVDRLSSRAPATRPTPAASSSPSLSRRVAAKPKPQPGSDPARKLDWLLGG